MDYIIRIVSLSHHVPSIFSFLTNHFLHLLHMESPKTRRRQLPADTKNKFIGAVEAGESITQAAQHYNIKEDIAQSIVKKYKATGSTENLPRTGHPLKLTETDKHHIV